MPCIVVVLMQTVSLVYSVNNHLDVFVKLQLYTTGYGREPKVK